jgi:hypothetical protein
VKLLLRAQLLRTGLIVLASAAGAPFFPHPATASKSNRTQPAFAA